MLCRCLVFGSSGVCTLNTDAEDLSCRDALGTEQGNIYGAQVCALAAGFLASCLILQDLFNVASAAADGAVDTNQVGHFPVVDGLRLLNCCLRIRGLHDLVGSLLHDAGLQVAAQRGCAQVFLQLSLCHSVSLLALCSRNDGLTAYIERNRCDTLILRRVREVEESNLVALGILRDCLRGFFRDIDLHILDLLIIVGLRQRNPCFRRLSVLLRQVNLRCQCTLLRRNDVELHRSLDLLVRLGCGGNRNQTFCVALHQTCLGNGSNLRIAGLPCNSLACLLRLHRLHLDLAKPVDSHRILTLGLQRDLLWLNCLLLRFLRSERSRLGNAGETYRYHQSQQNDDRLTQ